MARNTRLLQADNIRNLNDALITSELIEQNERDVNELYLATIAKNNMAFTGAQESQILSIALQCPMLGGNAVFKARALYAMIDDTQTYDDQATCLQYGFILREVDENEDPALVSVVPNPTSDQAVLNYLLPEDTNGEFVLYDITGKQMLHFILNSFSEQLPFSTVELQSGLYFYVVQTNKERIGQGRLEIMR